MPKYLGNDLQIPLVGLGTQEALRAIQTDAQLANRFKPVPLPRWRMNREFLRLLASFEQTLPLRQPSRLIEKPLAQKLLVQSEGSLGELSALLTTAAIYAVETEIEHINEAVLNRSTRDSYTQAAIRCCCCATRRSTSAMTSVSS
jgi:hypothetical protein